MIALLGYEIQEAPISGDQWAMVDGRTITVCSNLALKCAYQRVDLPAVRATCLGHELAHIRLHPDHDQWEGYEERERQADLYAAVFLVRWRELQASVEFAFLLTAQQGGKGLETRDLWRLVYSLARRFGVTATLIRRFLVELGVCEYDRGTRMLSVRMSECSKPF